MHKLLYLLTLIITILFLQCSNKKKDIESYTKAYKYFTNNDIEKSKAEIEKTLQLNPKNIDAIILRGKIKSLLKNDTGAINDFHFAIKIDSNSGSAYVNRAYCYLAMGDSVNAFKDVSKALSLKMDSLNLSLALCLNGILNYSKHNYKTSYHNLTKAITLNKNLPKAYYYIAQILSTHNKNNENYDKILDNINNSIKLDSNYAEAYYFRALLLLEAGNNQQACYDLEKALNLGMLTAESLMEENCL